MVTDQPHRMLVVHNVRSASERLRVIEPSPFRKFAFGSLLSYVDEGATRLGKQPMLVSHSLALPGDAPVYDAAQLADAIRPEQSPEIGEKYDSVMCHLVLDHGGVVKEDFFATLRADFLKPDGVLLNPVASITKNDVARASRFALETSSAPCVIKKNNNYNRPETVFELLTQAELEQWRSRTPNEEQRQYVMHKLLRYFGIEQSHLFQLERWIVLFEDLTINYRYSDEFYIKSGTSLSFYVRDERRLRSDLHRLSESGYAWKGRSIDCSYSHEPDAWDARYEVLRNFRSAFHFDYAELDVIQPTKGEFVVIDVNITPGPSYKNTHWRELGARMLTEALNVRSESVPEIGVSVVASAEPATPAEVSNPAPVAAEPGERTSPEQRRNIGLCMIVKNETGVLPRLFRSIKDYIDYYVIVDTGSTDGTIELIRREMAAYGIEGEVHERPWVNFGVNRQQALDLAVAAAKTEWLLFIDADEELGVSDPKFYEKLEPGVSYDIEKHHGGTRYAVPHLVNIKASRFRWEGVVHNYLVTVTGRTQRQLRKDVWIIYHHGQGAKSHGVTQEQKYLRDAKLLEDDLAQNPDNPRSQFYLAQSYRDAGHRDKAYVEYKKRAQMAGWQEERYVAQLEAARLAVALEQSEDVVLREYLDAFNMRPTRVEPLHDLARYFRQKGQHGKAYIFARTGVEIERPEDLLFVSQQIYDWRMLDELGVSAYWVGDYASAKEACETVLRRVQGGRLSIPADDLRRIEENLMHAMRRLGG